MCIGYMWYGSTHRVDRRPVHPPHPDLPTPIHINRPYQLKSTNPRTSTCGIRSSFMARLQLRPRAASASASSRAPGGTCYLVWIGLVVVWVMYVYVWGCTCTSVRSIDQLNSNTPTLAPTRRTTKPT